MRHYYFDAANYSWPEDTAEDADEAVAAEDAQNAGENHDLVRLEANHGKWLLFIDLAASDLQQAAEAYFDWREALQRIKTGDESILLAIDAVDGTLMSSPDSAAWGRPVETLELKIGKADRPASLDDLKDAFKEPNAIVGIGMGGKHYSAIRLNVDDVLMLMLSPDEGFMGVLKGSVGIRALLLLVITGICAIYACFQIKGTDGTSVRTIGRVAWDTRLSGRLTACTVLMCTVALVSSLFMEAVFVRAKAFESNRDGARDATMLYINNDFASQTLENWFDEEYLTRCRIARAVLAHLPPEKMTWDYLESLSEKLTVKYIYVFDAGGGIVAANSPYDHLTVGRGDPFYKLLEGCPEMTGVVTLPGTPDETLKRAGVSMRDARHVCTGLVMIVTDAVEMNEIKDNLGLGNAFELLCLANGSSLIAVNGDDKTIVGNAEVRDGKYETSLNSIDYTGYPISMINLSEDALQGDFNGILSFLGDTYSVSVKRVDNIFFLVFTARFRLEAANLIYAGLFTAAVLLFMALVMAVACPMRADAEAFDALPKETTARKKPRFLSFALNTTPFYEERWPREATPWRDKTPDEQFAVVLKLILFVVFAAIFINAYAARENSVWYFILAGQWGQGVNLHSITACLIYICLLIMLKALIHKLLYITAMSVDAQGETVCQLLDSALAYILAIVGVFICLGKLDVNTATLSLTAGVAGVIFSIGCQSIVADILAGFLMTFEGIVRVGDFLLFNDKPEFILSIGVRTTRLKFFGDVTVVRNNDFKNYVLRAGNKEARVMASLAIDFGESLERAEGILKEELPGIRQKLRALTDKPVTGPDYVGVTTISNYGVQLSFTMFCMGADVFPLTNALNRELKLMCERRGILIAHHMYTNQTAGI